MEYSVSMTRAGICLAWGIPQLPWILVSMGSRRTVTHFHLMGLHEGRLSARSTRRKQPWREGCLLIIHLSHQCVCMPWRAWVPSEMGRNGRVLFL